MGIKKKPALLAKKISAIQSCTDSECIEAILDDYISQFNMRYYIITCLPTPGTTDAPVTLSNKWPDDWWNHYLEHNYALHDPVIQTCFRSDNPMFWDENTPDFDGPSDNIERVHEIRKNAAKFRLRRGFVVPIHRAYGFCGAVSYVGQDIKIKEKEKPLLHLISIYAFECLYSLSGFEAMDIAILTKREKEVTKWAAKGFTTDQIASIVGISSRTVIMHLQNATKKMGATNRTHLVARALQFGQIEI